VDEELTPEETSLKTIKAEIDEVEKRLGELEGQKGLTDVSELLGALE
jgi:hypothetical protein